MGDSPIDYTVLLGSTKGINIEELVAALESRGADVRTTDSRFPILAGFRAHGCPDVLHLHFLHHLFRGHPVSMFVSGIRLLVSVIAAKLSGATIVWTVHNKWGHEPRSPRIEVLYRHLVARMCDRLIVHCESDGWP